VRQQQEQQQQQQQQPHRIILVESRGSETEALAQAEAMVLMP